MKNEDFLGTSVQVTTLTKGKRSLMTTKDVAEAGI